MNLISAYVAVGTISFVKNGFSYGFCTPFQNSYQNQIYAGERQRTGKDVHKEEPKGDLGTDLEKERKPEMNESDEKMKDFFEGFRRVKNIYFECKTKINQRLKSKAKSGASELKDRVLFLYQCVKVFSLRDFDEILNEDFIPITDYAFFVKDGTNITESFSRTGRGASTGHSTPLKEYAMRVLSQGWTTLLYDRIENLLRTHSLKFQPDGSLISKVSSFGFLEDDTTSVCCQQEFKNKKNFENHSQDPPQGRGRRRDHRMFALLVMGFIIMASILIPMGFQFLTVLGGKSLLLAKLALIMSAINGLKKIATSNVGYGFYHTGSDGHHHDHIHSGFHEKQYHINPQNYNGLQGYN